MNETNDPRNLPILTAYGRQVFLCGAGNCGPRADAQRLQIHFNRLAKRHGLLRLSNPHRVRCMLSGCMGVCSRGPILVVYPDGVWYHSLDADALERIFQEHLVEGNPVEEHIFYRLYPADGQPPYAPDARGDAAYEPTELELLAEQAAVEADRRPSRRGRRARRRQGIVLAYQGGQDRYAAALGVLMRGWAREQKGAIIHFGDEDRNALSMANVAHNMGVVHLMVGEDWASAQTFLSENELDLICLTDLDAALEAGHLDAFLAWLREERSPALHVVLVGDTFPSALVDMSDVVQTFPDQTPADRRLVAGVDF